MMSKQSNNNPKLDGILLRGYQKKLKTMKKKYFVLFEETSSNCSRLEYYDNEKKFKSGSEPKRVIKLKNCFNINRCLNTKHEFVISLSTKDGGFGIVLESEAEMLKWLEVLINLQRCVDSSVEQIKNEFEHIWQVVVQRRGLAEEKGIVGNYHVCLTPTSLTFISIGTQKPPDKKKKIQNIEFLLTTIRRCGDSQCLFYMEVGRQSIIGPGELWMETEDALIAQNMHTMILNAMSSRCEVSSDPMRKRSSSANESSKPITMLYRKQMQAENNTNIVSYQSGLMYGRERCDSLPSTRNRIPIDNSNQSLINLAFLPSRNVPRYSLTQHSHGNSPPVSTTIGCTESEVSSLSVDDHDDTGLQLPLRFHARTTEGVIPEEINEEIFSSDKCSEEDFSLNHSSKMIPNNEESYTLMGPKSCEDENTRCIKKGNEKVETISFLARENHGSANTIKFLEYTSDNFNKNSIAEAEIPSTSELPSRAYSIGSRLEHNKIKMRSIYSSADSDTNTVRVRAFSVGSRVKISHCDVKRGKAKDSNTNKKHLSSNNINLSEAASNCQSINVNCSYDKKATSAPLLIHKSQNSFDRMSDLMEIDFSKSHKEISSSSTRCCPLSMSVPVTYNDQQSFKSFVSSSNITIFKTNQNGYLEMKPVSLSSNHSSHPTFVQNIGTNNFDKIGEFTCISLKTTKAEPNNQNGVAINSKKIDELNTDVCICKKGIIDTIITGSNEKDFNINCNITDSANFEDTGNAQKNDQKRFQLKCSLENKNLCFFKMLSKNNNLIKIKSHSNKEGNEISNANYNIDFHMNHNYSCQNEAIYKEPTAKYQLDENDYKAFDDMAKTANNGKISNSSIVELSNKNNKNSVYEILKIKSETSLQSRKILQRPLPMKVDKQSLPSTVRPSSADSGSLLLMPSSLTSCERSALTVKTKNKNLSLYRTLSIGDSLNCFGNNSVENFQFGQQTRKTSRPPSISSESELHYASLELPKFKLKEYNGTAVAIVDLSAKTVCSGETLFGTPSKINPKRSLTYAKISFDHRESSNNLSSKSFNSSK